MLRRGCAKLIGAASLSLFLCLLLPPTAAQADELDAALAKAERKLVSHLNSLVKWGAGKRVSGFRHRVYRLILQFSPDDKRARGVLLYKRKGKKGPWVQDPEYAEPADFAKGTLAKAEARQRVALQKYRDAVLEAIDASGDPESPGASAAFKSLLAIFPQDGVLRRRLGDVEVDGAWLMPETVAARKRRMQIAAVIAKIEFKAGEGIEREEALQGGHSVTGWRTADRRVWSTFGSDAGKKCLRAMNAADLFCTHLLGKIKSTRGPEFSVLFNDHEFMRTFLASSPKWKSALDDLKYVSSVHLADGTLLTYDKTARRHQLSLTRQVVGGGLAMYFRGSSRGWITEGVGQRITWYLQGAHGPSFVSLEKTERHRSGAHDKLPSEAGNWTQVAARVLQRDGPARLAAVLTKRLNAMGAADVLVAYGLAAFLMETRPEDFLSFTKATVKGHDMDSIVKKTLGADDVAMLTRVLQRWLTEN